MEASDIDFVNSDDERESKQLIFTYYLFQFLLSTLRVDFYKLFSFLGYCRVGHQAALFFPQEVQELPYTFFSNPQILFLPLDSCLKRISYNNFFSRCALKKKRIIFTVLNSPTIF
jgi:hypothetical protein